jgi:hypothetical protein
VECSDRRDRLETIVIQSRNYFPGTLERHGRLVQLCNFRVTMESSLDDVFAYSQLPGQ